MVLVRDPVLKPVPIDSLRPTQMTVGMREVKDRRERLRTRKPNKIGKFLGDHMIPVILGPKQERYVIDHHHLVLALHREGVKNVLTAVVRDLNELDIDTFWMVLDHHGWVHPYDAGGKRRTFRDIPKAITGLKDDPFRSLAGELRRAGGFAKDTTPFSEFLWADFFRKRMKRKFVMEKFNDAVKKAKKLAAGAEAHYLPGWSGPVDG